MIALACLLGIVGVLLIVYALYKNNSKTPFLVVLGSMCFGASITIFGVHSKPTALDVYRGKTTLQITYQGSIPVDSVVVFKEQVK